MALERELETYKAKFPELVATKGRFVLIHGDDVVDVFASYEGALKSGYEKFKLDPFLVKRIIAAEQTMFISRFVDPATLVAAD
jgi:hypothetical protein